MFASIRQNYFARSLTGDTTWRDTADIYCEECQSTVSRVSRIRPAGLRHLTNAQLRLYSSAAHKCFRIRHSSIGSVPLWNSRDRAVHCSYDTASFQ